MIEERHKAAMVEKGRWRATAPHVRGHAGFGSTPLFQPLPMPRGKACAGICRGKEESRHPSGIRQHDPCPRWREAAEGIDETALAARAEPFGLDNIPPEVLLITAGVDVQRDRLEIVFLGWSRDEIFVLAQTVIYEDPQRDDVWTELNDLLRTVWRHPKGGILRVDAAAIDAGDGETMDRVMAFTWPRYGLRVHAIKGASGNRPAIKASDTRGTKLFIVGVDGVKAQLASRLTRGRTVRFSSSS